MDHFVAYLLQLNDASSPLFCATVLSILIFVDVELRDNIVCRG